MTAIYTKNDAIKKYDRQKIKDIKLFQEDINEKGSKKFYTCDPNLIFNKMIKNKKSHFYEFWTDNMKIQFSLDLDMNGLTDYNKSLEIVKENIIKVCTGVEKYYGFKYNINKIIVLESDHNISIKESNKISYHVIFRGLSFQNYLVAKDLYMRLHDEYNLEYSDKAIYNLTCLRLCFSCKFNKQSILMPIELNINGLNTLTEINSKTDLYNFWLKTLITTTYPSDTEIKQTQMLIPISKMKINTEIEKVNNGNISNINLEEILFKLPSTYYDEYDTWIKIGMILYSISDDSNKYFELWNRWSAQSEKYEQTKIRSVWDNFGNTRNTNKLKVGTLIKFCRDENIEDIFKKVRKPFNKIIEEYPVKPIVLTNVQNTLEINQRYLEPEIYTPFLNKKLLCVQSEKGTGKTSNLFKCLFDKNNKVITDDTTMLFISSRRTFGLKLLGDLKEFGFKLYSDIPDPDISAKRIICQIDSLGRLCRDTYDYVIIDECESLARYITGSHFTKNPKANMIVANLEMRVSDANKIIIMDADLSDRCMTYFSTILNIENEDVQLIINHYKPFNEYTIVSLTVNDWTRKVLETIGENKRIVIASASNAQSLDLKSLIELNYPNKKILLINRQTDDNEKTKLLMDVNITFNDVDILIYSPSVCMGVSFDLKNVFDSIFAYGCDHSLGSQEFVQMIHRIRYPINKNIYLTLSLFKEYNQEEDTVSYKNVEQILCSDHYLTQYDLHNNLIPCKIMNEKIITDDNIKYERVLVYPYKQDPNYDLFIRNSMEKIENIMNFGAAVYGYMKFKEYKMTHEIYEEKSTDISDSMKQIKNERKQGEIAASTESILNATDISKDDFINLIKKKDEYLEDEDINKINRYKFKNCYKLEPENIISCIIEEFNDKQKMKWYFNLQNILETEEQSIKDKLQIMKNNRSNNTWINSCYLDLITKDNYVQNLYSINVIEYSGFNINNLLQTITSSELETNIIDCINYVEFNKQEISYKFNLNLYNKNMSNIEFKDQLKIINMIIFFQFGLKIKKVKKEDVYQMSDNNVWNKLGKTIEPIELYQRETNIVSKKKYDISLLDFINESD